MHRIGLGTLLLVASFATGCTTTTESYLQNLRGYAVTKATPYRTENTGLLDNNVTSVAVDPLRHERWFGTPKGASRFSATGWRPFDLTTDPILAWTDVTCIGVDPDSGWKYFGTKEGQ